MSYDALHELCCYTRLFAGWLVTSIVQVSVLLKLKDQKVHAPVLQSQPFAVPQRGSHASLHVNVSMSLHVLCMTACVVGVSDHRVSTNVCGVPV